MKKADLNLNEKIWVWLYDFGPHTVPEMWPTDITGILAFPQAHTYAFRSHDDAIAHPDRMGWKKDHGYILQGVYLN